MSWKTYAEELPRAGFTAPALGLYAREHDPFLYFADIADSRSRRAHVVPFARTFALILIAGGCRASPL
jgi:hypothetical protein